MRRRNDVDAQRAAERDRWADAIAEANRRAEEDVAAARPALPVRAWSAVWRRRAQFVPVAVIAGLLAAGVAIRIGRPSPWLLGLGLAAALVGYYWRYALAAPRPHVAMLRPALAAGYLLASAVWVAAPVVEAVAG